MKGNKMSELTMFRTLAGTEIVGEVVNTGADFLVLKYPLCIRPVPQENNNYGLEFMLYSLTVPQGQHTFNRDLILSQVDEVPLEIENGYRSYTSGIQIVSSIG